MRTWSVHTHRRKPLSCGRCHYICHGTCMYFPNIVTTNRRTKTKHVNSNFRMSTTTWTRHEKSNVCKPSDHNAVCTRRMRRVWIGRRACDAQTHTHIIESMKSFICLSNKVSRCFQLSAYRRRMCTVEIHAHLYAGRIGERTHTRIPFLHSSSL